AVKSAWDGFHQLDRMRESLRTSMPSDTSVAVAHQMRAFIAKLDSVGGRAPGGGGFGGGGGGGGAGGANARLTFVQAVGRFIAQLGAFDNGDMAPTAAMLAAYSSTCTDFAKTVAAWKDANGKDLAALNTALKAAGLHEVAAAPGVTAPRCAEPT